MNRTGLERTKDKKVYHFYFLPNIIKLLRDSMKPADVAMETFSLSFLTLQVPSPQVIRQPEGPYNLEEPNTHNVLTNVTLSTFCRSKKYFI